jgi:hypothetical protein
MQPTNPEPGHKFQFLIPAILLTLMLLFAATSVAQQQSPQELISKADEILQQMSRITGLPIKGAVKKQVISRPEIEKYLIQNLHQEMTPAEIHAEEAVVRAFGLVSSDFNLEKFLVGFYTEQAAGFYDPQRRTMFIADWIPAEMQNMVLSHELTHALQDQAWDLETYLHGARGDDDASNARQAVVEGYATAAMMQQAAGGMDLGQLPSNSVLSISLPSITPLMEAMISQQFDAYPAFSNAPYFFRKQALFPYIQGMGFVQAGLQRGGWKNLDTLFQHPPSTTKEIYSPQTYLNHEGLPKVQLPRPPALEGLTSLHFLAGNSMGELGYNAFLGQLISEQEATSVGRAWVADRYVLYERSGGNDYALVARTRWANPEQALAFFRDYRTILAKKYSDLTSEKSSSPDEFIGSAANGAVVVLRKGDECVWAEGVPTAKAEVMLAWLRAL